MLHARKLIQAALLLAGGLALASLFRRPVPPPPAVDPAADLVLRHDDRSPRSSAALSSTTLPVAGLSAAAGPKLGEPPIQPPAALMPARGARAERPASRHKRRDDAQPRLAAPFTWSDPAPPEIAGEYPGAAPPPRRSWNASAVDDWPGLDRWSRADRGDETQGTDDAADDPPRRHTIVDGDTLAALAQRYLGDAQRADELFSTNRDVLSDPRLLPIGGVLRVPPRRAAEMDTPHRGPLVPVTPSAQ
jgi:hypothetical protein